MYMCQVFIGVCVGLLYLVGNSDAAVDFSAALATAKIDNNAADGSAVESVVSGGTANGAFAYSITGVTPGDTTYFAIDSSSGAITLDTAGFTAVSALTSTAAATQYVITVSGDDADGNPATHDITVSVNFPPEIVGSPFTFNVNDGSATSTDVGTIVVTDPDSDGMNYALKGTGNGDFTIANKVITAATTLSTQVYTLEAEVDDGSLISTAAITINVNAASSNTDPVFSSTTYSFTTTDGAASGTDVGSVTITDADTDTWTFTITSGDSNGDFAITNTGNLKVGKIATAKDLVKGTASSYSLTVTLSDATTTVTTTVTITFSGASTLVPMFFLMIICSLYNYV